LGSKKQKHIKNSYSFGLLLE